MLSVKSCLWCTSIPSFSVMKTDFIKLQWSTVRICVVTIITSQHTFPLRIPAQSECLIVHLSLLGSSSFMFYVVAHILLNIGSSKRSVIFVFLRFSRDNSWHLKRVTFCMKNVFVSSSDLLVQLYNWAISIHSSRWAFENILRCL